MFNNEPAILFSYANSLESGGGGVQRCTRDYIKLLTTAGFNLSPVPYEYDRRLHLRLLRRVRPRPYDLQIPKDTAPKVVAQASRIGAKWIFLNHGDAAPLAAQMEDLAPQQFRFVLLSHGNDSTDFIHESRIRQSLPRIRDKLWLGSQLFEEISHRPHLHAVFCLSQLDLHIEEWLGARNILFLPQISSGSPLESRPVKNRIGTVGTLNHPPNYEGIRLFAKALLPYSELRLRLVGRPEQTGRLLLKEFSNIDYLGGLSETALEAEASTWACFVNPIFCHGRGASTKLSQALAWRLPVASTRAGARGYYWNESLIPLAKTPDQLAMQAAELAGMNNWHSNRKKINILTSEAPDTKTLARSVCDFLSNIV